MNVYLFLALFFIIIGILSYSFFIEPKCLVIHKNQIKVTESGKTLRIVQLSDIHLKKNYSVKALKQIVEKTNTLQPDIVVFTGDLFDDYARFGIEIQDEVIQLFRYQFLRNNLRSCRLYRTKKHGQITACLTPYLLVRRWFRRFVIWTNRLSCSFSQPPYWNAHSATNP